MPLVRTLSLRKFIGAKATKAIGMAAAGVILTGCVPIEDYQSMRLKADQYAEQLGHAQTEISEANQRAETYKQQLAMAANNAAGRSATEANYASQIAELDNQRKTWEQKYNDAIAMLGATEGTKGDGPLPAKLNNQLADFASQYPDLVEFDQSRGMVKFKSDVTFALGDATVTPKVKEIISRFAAILNSAGADQYELLVAGHTDSTPVTNENTIKHGHFDNWYLSAHRAIAVGEELTKDGVSSKRMGVVGYADKRPIASNSTASGKAQNRRVEVLILPTTVRSGPSMAAAEPKPHRTHAAAAPAPIPAAASLSKDNGVTFTK